MQRVRVQPQAERASVSQLELFFDLVFVFALTQVTDLLAHDPNLTNLARSVLVLAVLWWAWADSTGYYQRKAMEKMEAKKRALSKSKKKQPST